MCRAWEEEGGKGETMQEETQRKHGRTRPSSEYTAEMPAFPGNAWWTKWKNNRVPC